MVVLLAHQIIVCDPSAIQAWFAFDFSLNNEMPDIIVLRMSHVMSKIFQFVFSNGCSNLIVLFHANKYIFISDLIIPHMLDIVVTI